MLVYVLKGSNCLMSKSTLMELGCLPKSFPEIGRFNKGDGDASANKITAEPSETGSRHDHKSNEAVRQTIPLLVPVRGKNEDRQGSSTGSCRDHNSNEAVHQTISLRVPVTGKSEDLAMTTTPRSSPPGSW